MSSSTLYAGIDVAKATLDLVLRPTDARQQVSNDEAGIQTLAAQLTTLAPALATPRG